MKSSLFQSPLRKGSISDILSLYQSIAESFNAHDVSQLLLSSKEFTCNAALMDLYVQLGYDIENDIFKESVSKDKALEALRFFAPTVLI